jgi:hypothetical protein
MAGVHDLREPLSNHPLSSRQVLRRLAAGSMPDLATPNPVNLPSPAFLSHIQTRDDRQLTALGLYRVSATFLTLSVNSEDS